MVAVLGARPALQPCGDLGVDVVRARFGTLTPLPQHVLPDLVEIEGGAKPISDLSTAIFCSRRSNPCASAGSTPKSVGSAVSGLGGLHGAAGEGWGVFGAEAEAE